MKKVIIVLISCVVLTLFIGSIFGLKKINQKSSMPQVLEKEKISSNIMKKRGEKKKVAMVVAYRDFRDEEYFIPKNVFTQAGIEVTTVSEHTGTAVGASGGEAEVDLSFDQLNVDNFDAIVFSGGPGAYKYADDPIVQKIAQQAVGKNKILAAICIAPTILAKAGVLEGKRATVWSNVLQKTPIKILKENGAIYQGKPVVQDGNIITANGPQAAKSFAETVIRVLNNQK